MTSPVPSAAVCGAVDWVVSVIVVSEGSAASVRARGISKSSNLVKDIRISKEISRFRERFQDFRGFPERFQDS